MGLASLTQDWVAGGRLLVLKDKVIAQDNGGRLITTNNRMELHAAINGVGTAEQMGAKQIRVFSDSRYVTTGGSLWCVRWQSKNWMIRKGKAVKNSDYWQVGFNLFYKAGAEVSFEWVKGHSGLVHNEAADQLAGAGRLTAMKRSHVAVGTDTSRAFTMRARLIGKPSPTMTTVTNTPGHHQHLD
jgi:ribonuclease HI